MRNPFIIRQKMLLDYFSTHNKNYRDTIGYNHSKSSCRRYEAVCCHLGEFINREYGFADIRFKDINEAFVRRFDNWLRTEKRLRNNTVWIQAYPVACTLLQIDAFRSVFQVQESL